MGNKLKAAVAKIFWLFCPYKHLVEKQPAPQKRLLIGAPHTSNLDFVLMLAIAWQQGLNIRWLGKKEMFQPWAKPLLKKLGGIPVDRANPAGLVQQIIELAAKDDNFTLVITPEGTRRGNGWKSGFYHIAKGADLPVSLGFVDKPSRTTGIGPTIKLSGDPHTDMEKIRQFYADKHGVRPKLRTEPQIKEENTNK